MLLSFCVFNEMLGRAQWAKVACKQWHHNGMQGSSELAGKTTYGIMAEIPVLMHLVEVNPEHLAPEFGTV
jgi:hypothetical protein